MNEYDPEPKRALPKYVKPIRRQSERSVHRFFEGLISGTVTLIFCVAFAGQVGMWLRDLRFSVACLVLVTVGMIVWSVRAQKRGMLAFARGLIASFLLVFCVVGLLVGACFYTLRG